MTRRSGKRKSRRRDRTGRFVGGPNDPRNPVVTKTDPTVRLEDLPEGPDLIVGGPEDP